MLANCFMHDRKGKGEEHQVIKDVMWGSIDVYS